jgi:hypothetical protein
MIRTHPAIIAHAAATTACLMPGRFFLGIGTGENLNEHVLGAKWPAPDERLEMLEEAVEVMRLLWQGDYQTHRGKHCNADELEDKLVLGNDPDEFLEEIKTYDEAGYTHVYVHQVGPDQDAFLKFAKSELFPRL